MPISSRDSDLHMVLGVARSPGLPLNVPTGIASRPDATASPLDRPQKTPGGLWLDGNVLACGCPDCGAPMTIRLWLMTADCWRCGCGIELTEQQEQEARQLLESRRRSSGGDRLETYREGRTGRTGGDSPPVAHGVSRSRPSALPAPPLAPRPSPLVLPPAASPLDRLRSHDWLRDLPAWLVSLIFHLVLIILLGLWPMGSDRFSDQIVLTASLGPQHRAGGEVEFRSVKLPEYDLPIDKPPKNERERSMLRRADEDAKELRLDADEAKLPRLERVVDDLKSPDAHRRMMAARDPRVRKDVIEREGGTLLTEAAVARALRWINRHQNDDGSFSLHAFHEAGDCDGRCGGRGALRSDTGGTALATLAFLGAGQRHEQGIYKETVSRGVRWLLDRQKPDGDLRADGSDQAGMYVHALATIVLCESFQMTGDETLRGPAQRAVNFIVKAQHPLGGWRYLPGQEGDLSVVGWQLMALQSAEAAYLHVPPETFDRADEFLDRVASGESKSLYAYMPNHGPSPAMTAEGLLSRMYLGWNRDEPGLAKGIDWLVTNHMPSVRQPNIYYWYYGTQAMHHWGGQPWLDWNQQMRDILVTTQKQSGHEAGSWDPISPHGPAGGRLYFTALAACTLEVYYRHTPLYRRIELR